MYKQIMSDIKEKRKIIEEQILELQTQLKSYDNAFKALQDLQGQYEKECGNLAVQKGVCPFPEHCNERNVCTLDICNADECSNGFAFRRS